MAHVSIGSTFGYLNEQKQTRNPFKNKKKSQNSKISKISKFDQERSWSKGSLIAKYLD